MTDFVKDIESAALAWLVQVNDPAFDQWDAWEAWLAADSRHAETYWRLAETEADAVEALRSAPVRRASAARNWRAPATPRITRRAGVAAAVAAMAIAGGWLSWSQRPQTWVIQTAPGESRAVTLADGTQVSLDGATRLTLDRRDPRDVRLDAGRALFTVVHDDAHPFVVQVADAVLTDLGTVFDVTRLTDGARVSVSEGQVQVQASGASALLNPGDSVVATSGGLERRSIPLDAVAGWREGRLVYDDEGIAVIADDLSRIAGRPVTVAPGLSGRRFSGSLGTQGSPEMLRARLTVLFGVAIADDGQGWRLEPRAAP